jgi:hypothetical protein
MTAGLAWRLHHHPAGDQELPSNRPPQQIRDDPAFRIGGLKDRILELPNGIIPLRQLRHATAR